MLPRNEELWRKNGTIVDLIYYIDVMKLSKLKLYIKPLYV
jgi:hypothetical protein